MEEEETLVFVETEEDKMSYRELLHMIDQIEIGHQQHMQKEEVIEDKIHRCPLILYHQDFQIGVV